MAQTVSSKIETIHELLDKAYFLRVNNLKLSITLSKQALGLSREIKNLSLIGKSLNQLALFKMIRGEYKSSAALSEEAIGYFEKLKDAKGVADSKYNLAGIYYKSDNYHLGLIYLIDCLPVYRKFNDFHNLARVHKSLGTIYDFFGDQKNAILSYQNSIENAIKAGDTNLESNAYNPLSGIYLKQNKAIEAESIIRKSIELKEQTKDLRGLAFAIYGLGKVNFYKGELIEAENNFLTALKIHLDMGEKLGSAMTFHKLGSLYTKLGELDKAMEYLKKGLDISEGFSIAIFNFKCNYALYKLFKIQNNLEKSLFYLEKYLKIKDSVINTQTLKIIENYDLISKMKALEIEAKLQKREAKKLIKLSNERYELATKATKDIIWDWDIVNDKIYRSANYKSIFGYPLTENNIYRGSWVDNIHEEDRIRVLSKIKSSLRNLNTDLWEDDYRYYKSNGELAYIKDHGYIVRDNNKKAIRMVGAMWDFSSQKAYELQLEKMAHDIRQRNNDLEQFGYIISHNLRSPVANIIGFSELLKEEGNSKEEFNEFVEVVSVSAKKLDLIIADLNNILQVKSNLGEKKKKVHFSAIVKDIKEIIKNVIEREKVEIITDFHDIDEFHTLKSYIHSIFYNLITNSIKYRQPNLDLIIEIRSKVRGNIIELIFKDNGLGIDLKTKGNQVFGLYKRFHTNTSEGRGIGLFMTKTQVESLGGRINLHSEVNKGTQFIIEFIQ
jgi:signal transduction histidine kinase